jgi:hypothetical protein
MAKAAELVWAPVRISFHEHYVAEATMLVEPQSKIWQFTSSTKFEFEGETEFAASDRLRRAVSREVSVRGGPMFVIWGDAPQVAKVGDGYCAKCSFWLVPFVAPLEVAGNVDAFRPVG